MSKLSDEIEALRARMVDEHATAVRLLERLDARMVASDTEVMQRLQAMLAADAARKADITAALTAVAVRIGCVPSVPLTRAVPAAPGALRYVEDMPPACGALQRVAQSGSRPAAEEVPPANAPLPVADYRLPSNGALGGVH